MTAVEEALLMHCVIHLMDCLRKEGLLFALFAQSALPRPFPNGSSRLNWP